VCGLSVPFAWLPTYELKSAEQLFKLGAAFPFAVLCSLYTKACKDRQLGAAGPLQDDPFSPWPLLSLFPFGSPYLPPLHRHTLSFLSQSLEIFCLAVCLSLLNPNHFIHHLPEQEIKPEISLSSSDVAYLPAPTSPF